MRKLPARAAGIVLIFAGAAGAQQVAGPAPDPQPSEQTAAKTPAPPPRVSFAGGELRISATDTTLAEVVAKVTALTGVTIDLPAGASTGRLTLIELGPGPVREVLASLLSDSNMDFPIQSSEADPRSIQSVLVMKREKKGPGLPANDVVAHSSRSAALAAITRAEEPPPAPEPAAPAENTVAAADNPGAAQPPLAQPDQSTTGASSQPFQSNVPKTAPLSPPASLNQQSINQQLQQMYEQRMQMNQQAAPANPPIK